MQSFLLSLRGVGKRSMSSGFSPRICLPHTRVVQTWLGLCENIKPVQDRISTTLHESTPMSEPEFRLMSWKTFLPLLPWISPIRGLLHCRHFAGNAGTMLFTCHRRRKYLWFVHPSQVHTWHTGLIRVSSSLSLHKEMLKFDRIPISFDTYCRRILSKLQRSLIPI